MAEITKETHIARPPDEVWAVLADFAGISTWAPNVDHSCLTTAQTEGIGAVRRIQAGRNVVLERIVEWETGERLGYAITGLPPVIKSVTNTWTLTGDPAGAGTQVALTSRINAGPRPPQQLVARGVGQVLAKASVQMLDGLAAHVSTLEPTAGGRS